MEPSLMRERVGAARVGHLATVRPDGRPHVVPCCFVLETRAGADTVFSAVDAKPKTSLELARLEHVSVQPAVSLLVDFYDEDWTRLWWVRADATARVQREGPEREHALDLLAAKYPQYREVRPPGAVLELAVTGWRSWPR